MTEPDSVSEGELIRLVLVEEKTIRQAHRELVEAGYSGSYKRAQILVRKARAERAASETTETIAARMVALVSAELTALERSKAPKDLDRLQRLAQTLGQLDRLAPKGRKKREEPSLLSLMPNDPKGRGEGDLRDQLEELDSAEGVRSRLGS